MLSVIVNDSLVLCVTVYDSEVLVLQRKAETAWSEKERRSSGTEATSHRAKQKEAHGRWMKRNRVSQ